MTEADLILSADGIIPMTDGFDENAPLPTHVAIDGEYIVAIGTADDVEPFAGPVTVRRSYPGATIVPGLSDGHAHPILGLDLTRGVSLYDARTIDEIRRRVAEEAAKDKDAPWILGWGLNTTAFDGVVSGRLFDDVTDGRPVYLRMRDGHSALINSAAMEMAGITGSETFEDGSSLPVDELGRPTGHLLEFGAVALVEPLLPRETTVQRALGLLELLDDMAAAGLTSAQVMDMQNDPEAVLNEAEARGELSIRLRLSPLLSPDITPEELESWASAQGRGGRRWVIEGVKIMLDGTIEGGTAWMEHADTQGENHEPLWEPAVYARTVRFYTERGISTATHAIGDNAVKFVLDTFEAMPEDFRTRAPHRVEHIETVPDETLRRFADLGILASMQPIHFTRHLPGDGSDVWTQRIGTERAAHANRVRDLVDSGAKVILGSDWPVAEFRPLSAMADAILRRPHMEVGRSPLLPAQALTPLMTIAGYTSWSAIGRNHADTEGQIAAGFRADLTLLAGNPLTIDAEDLGTLEVVATVVGGSLYDQRRAMPA